MSDPIRPARPDAEIWNDSLVDRFRERLAELRVPPFVLVFGLVILIAIGALIAVRARPSSATPKAALTRETTSTTSPKAFVHIAGAVAKPGVVELPENARVIDALEAVGGASEDANLDALNMASKVADGQRIYVPHAGEEVASPDGTSADVNNGGKISLNSASASQLEELPGVGPALAQAIIAQREKAGGFDSVNDLRNVRGIGEKRFEQLKDLVTV